MSSKLSAAAAVPILVLATLSVATFVTPAVASADPLPYGPDTCVQGFVWREARPGDTVCVTPAVRDTVAFQNANPGSNRDPNAGSGPLSCSQGYVWREAFDGDTICVTPDVRSATLADNAAAGSRRQATAPVPAAQARSMVVFEITGTGTVYTIDTSPSGPPVAEGTAMPFARTMYIGPDVDQLTVVAVGKTGQLGCRITVDGQVVLEQSRDAFCVYNRG